MTIHPESTIDHISNRFIPLSFCAGSVLFNLCLIAQVLTVGIATFVNPEWWKIHVWLVRGYGGLSLLLLALVFITPVTPQIRRLTVSLPVLLSLQFFSIHIKSPLHLEALHPLIGFSLLYSSSTLVHRVLHNLSAPHPQNEPV